MTFQPGHKFSPGRRHGSRNKRTEEIFNRLENRGDLDPADLLSSIVTNNEEPKELRIQAAGLLMPYKYSKCGTAPVQVYIDVPIETPAFERISDAEGFLAKLFLSHVENSTFKLVRIFLHSPSRGSIVNTCAKNSLSNSTTPDPPSMSKPSASKVDYQHSPARPF